MPKDKKQTIDAEELVPDDVVLLKSGDMVPADLRLIKTKDFSRGVVLNRRITAVEKKTRAC
ncbi:MAG: hypothetical protein ACLFNU_10550 [Bacteroidales bacterium]